MTTAGRSFLPDSSEKTKPTSTTSPRLHAIILRILLVIPELRQHGVGLRGQRPEAFALVPEILPEPLLDGLEHVLPDREVPLGRRSPRRRRPPGGRAPPGPPPRCPRARPAGSWGPAGPPQPEAAAHLGAHVHADPRPLRLRLHGAHHLHVPPRGSIPRRHIGVNDTTSEGDGGRPGAWATAHS